MILVIGGTGTLGGYLTQVLDKERIDFIAPSSKELDLTSDESVDTFFSKVGKLNLIYLLAAETNVDLCETNPEQAYKLNVQGTERIAKYAAQLNTPLIFISSSAVFGGGVPKWRYCEIDVPLPVNLYGCSKLFAEDIVKKLCPQHLIIRSSWMIGGGPERDKKFLSKIIPKLRQNEDIIVVHDKYGSLTYARDLAEFLLVAYKKKYSGIIHFASKNYASRYDIVKYISELLDSKSKVSGIDSCRFPLPAPRDNSESLYSITGYVEEKDWKEIIKDYMKEWA